MLQPTKASLRAEMRKILAGISEPERGAASGEIRRRVAGLAEWKGARIVGIFAGLDSEPDLMGLIRETGKRVCLPRISGEGLEFYRVEGSDVLRPGARGVREPDPEKCAFVAAEEIEVFAVPGLAFTRDGKRLGRGGGFYDRFLSGVAAGVVKIGVCFEAQIVAELPVEIHDREVDLIVTEAGVARCGEA